MLASSGDASRLTVNANYLFRKTIHATRSTQREKQQKRWEMATLDRDTAIAFGSFVN